MEVVRLRTGREVTIRPIRPGDAKALRDAYDHLSAETKYRRFLAPKPHLGPSDIRYLVDIDRADHYALVATPSERLGWILGVARFVRLPEDPLSAELAVVVGDPFQGEGLATELLARLAVAAQQRGIICFRATMLAHNEPAHKLVRRFGGPHVHERHLGPTVEIEAPLQSSRGAVEADRSRRAEGRAQPLRGA
jgi:RimJ/RimL family protein N-acetyltransferase